jgi:hypothetical protein
MITLALTAMLASQSVSCDDIRGVAALARQEGLDDRSLVVLEDRYCRRDAPVQASAGCRELTILTTLARAQGRDEKTVTEFRRQVCAIGGGFPKSWPNGVRAARDAGDRFWPNGVRARSARGEWYYPNGVKAGSLATSLYYPNGVKAFGNDRWYHPNGAAAPTETEVIHRACKKRECRGLRRIRDTRGELRAFLLIALAARG